MRRRDPLLMAIASLALAQAGAQAAEPASTREQTQQPNTHPPPVVVRPTVIGYPSGEAFRRGYPVKGWNDHVAGQAYLRCVLLKSGVLTECGVSRESPTGEGFGEAALKLAPLYRLTPVTVDGVAVDQSMTMDIDFPLPTLPGEPAASETPVGHPWWTCPDPNTPPNRYYPKGAQGRDVEGVATIECRILTTGKFTACAWVSEDPPGYGFGEKAERMGCQFKINAPAPEGAAPEPRIFRTPVRFKIGP